MLNIFLARIKSVIQSIEIKFASLILKRLGFDSHSIDYDQKIIIFSIDNLSVSFSLSDLGHVLEANLKLNGYYELMQLKTMSDLSDMAYRHGCSLSGLEHSKSDLGSRMAIAIRVPTISYNTFTNALKCLISCISQMDQYIIKRMEQSEMSSLDISMFEGISLHLLNLKEIGEKKTFIYGDWANYRAHAIQDESFDGFEYGSDVDSCREFEEKNKMLLSEVGDIVLKEIVSHRKILEMAEDNHSIN